MLSFVAFYCFFWSLLISWLECRRIYSPSSTQRFGKLPGIYIRWLGLKTFAAVNIHQTLYLLADLAVSKFRGSVIWNQGGIRINLDQGIALLVKCVSRRRFDSRELLYLCRSPSLIGGERSCKSFCALFYSCRLLLRVEEETAKRKAQISARRTPEVSSKQISN